MGKREVEVGLEVGVVGAENGGQGLYVVEEEDVIGVDVG